MKVQLTPQQEQLKEIIVENLQILKNWKSGDEDNIRKQAFQQMKEASHELHMGLSPRPKHHRHMIENRGMQPEHPEFYHHIHPVKDLLKYLEDTSANDDPLDLTLGDTFDFRVYTSLLGHDDNYQLTRTASGWEINHESYSGEDNVNSDMDLLYEIMTHDSISFPRNVNIYMREIWNLAQENGLNHEEVQNMLNEVADWISLTEKNAPRHILS